VALDVALIGVAAFILSALLTGGVRRFALSRGLLDVPNARSSHKVVTPRGGGLAMVLAATASWAVLTLRGHLPVHLFVALVGGGVAVAFIGFMDDRGPIPAYVRFAVHITAAAWALAWLGAPSQLQVGSQVIALGWGGAVLAILGITWFLNLFNFMDGIDGIAASEAIFIACAGAVLQVPGMATAGVTSAGFLLAASCCGFLLWNWPPARIFMGDVGSGYLGYVIGVLVLALARENAGAVWTWLILGGVFFVDATVTLIRRAARGETVFEAHRSHAYQWLCRRWGSHMRVTLGVTLVNLLWLLPCAVATIALPKYAMWIAFVALLPLVAVALVSGAGRPETV
jgi:Fuc2NAc and GlcNAc transferase